MEKSLVAAVITRPERVLADYKRVMELAHYRDYLSAAEELILKLNLSWTKYFPACSTQPWQLEGVVKALIQGGFSPERLLPVENKTVVTDPRAGAVNNCWQPILDKYGLTFIPLPEVEWVYHDFAAPLLVLNKIFPKGIEIPKLYLGRSVLHLPTLKTHGHSITTGAIKNSFGGLLKEARHYAHKYIHETMVDLLLMQQELHPQTFAVLDGTVAGDGAGPRTMVPRIANILLAGADPVALDAVAARVMGFDPLSIPYLRMATEMGLGTADPDRIELVGDDIGDMNLGFRSKRSFVIWGDQMLRRGPLRFLERIALHSPLMGWAPLASNIYHDLLWYPTVGRARIKAFSKTEWGSLWEWYRSW
ncbi:MAG: DUF362 domain-containing protein [Firmicutes bacterium]|nr:DUF362 domain-containing protein [Bacillota bacterium]